MRSSGCATTLLATYTYDPLSRRTNLAYGNGASIAYSYTNAGDLLTLNHVMSGTNPQYTFTYSAAHQLASENISDSNYLWQPPATSSTSYAAVNTLNQYPSVGGVTYGYDGNGNLTSTGPAAYTYDAENRMLTAASAMNYAYDPLGRRTTKTTPTGPLWGAVNWGAFNWTAATSAASTYFLSDGTDEIAEYGNTGSVTTRYVPGPAIDEPIAMVTAAGAKSFFHPNHQGSIIAMSGSGGVLSEGPYTYDPYGNCFSAGILCSAGEPYRFTGRRLDAETGLYYYRARMYGAGIGRFHQTDPVGYTADLNLYAYVGNDPLIKGDPMGRDVVYFTYAISAYYVAGGEGSAGEALDLNALRQGHFSATRFYTAGFGGGGGAAEGGYGGAGAGGGYFRGSLADFHGGFVNGTISGKAFGGISLSTSFPPEHMFDPNYANVSITGGPGVAGGSGAMTYTWFGTKVDANLNPFLHVVDQALSAISGVINVTGRIDSKKLEQLEQGLKQARQAITQYQKNHMDAQCKPGGPCAGGW